MTENEVSSIIIGESLYIHTRLGPGLLESVYEHCLAHRLSQRGLKVETQKPVPVIFEEVKLECGFRCDMIIEDKVVVELKSVETLNEVHKAQLLTQIRLMDIRLGLLINFNVRHLIDGIKRLVNHL